MDILICEAISGPAVEALGEEFDVSYQPDIWRDPERLQQTAGAARALIVRNQTRVTAELIQASSRLKVIGRAGAGLDNIDVDAARTAGIAVTHTPDENSLSVAELTLGLMLSLARRIPYADRTTRAGGWKRAECTGSELMGKTLGIVGLGRIGTLVAERATVFGMQILAYDAVLDAAAAKARAGAQWVTLDELLEQADFVTCHVPLLPATRGLFGEDQFGRMKPAAFFINTSRGEIVREPALIEALTSGRLAGAALDVRQTEPPAPSPLSDMDNVILTPHIAAFTAEAQTRVVETVCRNIAAALRS